MKMREMPQPHLEAAAKSSPAFAEKIAPKAQMPEFKTRAPVSIGGAGKISWAVKKGVK